MDFQEIKENILENKRRFLLLGFTFIFVILLIILVIVLANSHNKKTPEQKEKIILSEELLIPNGPEVQREYTITRQAKDTWTQEEADDWFTSPSEKDIQALEKSNENMILDLVEAAP